MDEKHDVREHASGAHAVAEPVRSEQAIRDIDELGLIGINALADEGYFVRVVFEHRAPAPKLLNPQEVHVLIVEDDENTAALIELTLRTRGYQTRRACNRQETAEGLAETPLPHLVLLDVLMPDANGFDVLDRIRQNPALENIPVLMLTALAERRDVVNGLRIGADGYVTKPVLPSVLLKAVEAVLGG